MHSFKLSSASLALAFFGILQTRAADIGPGNVNVATYDTAPNLIAVDLTAPLSLPAGTYTATTFNHQFNFGAGTIEPLLLTGNGVNSFTTIAAGTTLTSAQTTPYGSTTFGGQNTFTLGSTTTVYAGLYWAAGAPAMPVGYAGAGSSFLRYAGAATPVVGNAIGGGSSGTFARTYDFSVTVTAVPEPTVPALLGLGFAFLVRCHRKRRC